MQPDPVVKPSTDGPTQMQMTRRVLLQRASAAATFSALAAVPLLSQTPELQQVIGQMSVMTDSLLPKRWQGPTASLVGVILDYSKGLRALDLGEREPATFFSAR